MRGFYNYYNDIWNMVDLLNFFFYLTFHLMRKYSTYEWRFLPISFMSIIHHELDKDSHIDLFLPYNQPLDSQRIERLAIMQLVVMALTVSILLKIFSFLQVVPSVGAFIETFYQIMAAGYLFCGFFLMWIMTFMFLYMISGFRLEDETSYESQETMYQRYNRLEIMQSYFILAWKNSVTGPEDPTDSFWTNLSEEKRLLAPTIVGLMNFCAVLLWAAGIYLLFIIMLNMYISIVSESYTEFKENEEMFVYRKQSSMNKECQLMIEAIKGILGFVMVRYDGIDCIIISSQKEQEDIT